MWIVNLSVWFPCIRTNPPALIRHSYHGVLSWQINYALSHIFHVLGWYALFSARIYISRRYSVWHIHFTYMARNYFRESCTCYYFLTVAVGWFPDKRACLEWTQHQITGMHNHARLLLAEQGNVTPTPYTCLNVLTQAEASQEVYTISVTLDTERCTIQIGTSSINNSAEVYKGKEESPCKSKLPRSASY